MLEQEAAKKGPYLGAARIGAQRDVPTFAAEPIGEKPALRRLAGAVDAVQRKEGPRVHDAIIVRRLPTASSRSLEFEVDVAVAVMDV